MNVGDAASWLGPWFAANGALVFIVLARRVFRMVAGI